MDEAIIPTGVRGLDVLLSGGLPRRQTVVVTGEPGSGKTILCSQIAFSLAARGMPVVIATVTSEPHDKLVSALSNFAFFDRSRIGEELFFVSAYPYLKKSPKEARDMLISAVRDRGAKMLFVDGLRSIRDLWANESMLREFLYDLNLGLGATDCIGLLSTEYPLDRLLELPEATTVDGVVSLSLASEGSRRVRRVEVHKLRGRAHIQGAHVMVIDDNGVSAVPRLESIVTADDRAVCGDARAERLRSACPSSTRSCRAVCRATRRR